MIYKQIAFAALMLCPQIKIVAAEQDGHQKDSTMSSPIAGVETTSSCPTTGGAPDGTSLGSSPANSAIATPIKFIDVRDSYLYASYNFRRLDNSLDILCDNGMRWQIPFEDENLILGLGRLNWLVQKRGDSVEATVILRVVIIYQSEFRVNVVQEQNAVVVVVDGTEYRYDWTGFIAVTIGPRTYLIRNR